MPPRRGCCARTRGTGSSSRCPGLKLGGALLALLLIGAALLPVDHRVAAQAVVEGAVQRAAVAPFSRLCSSPYGCTAAEIDATSGCSRRFLHAFSPLIEHPR